MERLFKDVLQIPSEPRGDSTRLLCPQAEVVLIRWEPKELRYSDSIPVHCNVKMVLELQNSAKPNSARDNIVAVEQQVKVNNTSVEVQQNYFKGHLKTERALLIPKYAVLSTSASLQ